jgi:peptidoglycan/LPS O-acetylase OafA/YrhL
MTGPSKTRFAKNLFFSDQSAFAEGRLNSVLWTMRPELIGSFIVFGFLAMFGRHAGSAVIAFGISALLALSGFTMLALFPMGVCIALLRTQLPNYSLSIPMATVLILVGLGFGGLYDYSGESKFRLPIVHTVVNSADAAPCLGAVFVVLGLVFTPAFCTALERRAFIGLGKISFGLYLCHVPIIMSAGCWLYVTARGEWGFAHGEAIGAVTALVVPLSLLGGWILYYVADKPSVIVGKWLANRILAERPSPAPGVVPATN